MPDAVAFHTARNVAFVRDTFTHLGAAGLGLDQGSQHNQVIGNVLTDISGNGLQVGSAGNPSQPDPNLVDSGTTRRRLVPFRALPDQVRGARLAADQDGLG
ncbi:MAG TPA: hypothetical protein VFG87_11035 [Amycolatopsis sp.]|nr:hypothetical protein [Amycolatopsis sp.]